MATVSKTLKASRAKHLGSAELAAQGEERARLLLFGPVEKVGDHQQPDFADVERQLKKDGVNLSLLWDEYARSCAAAGVKGYQYSQYCGLYAQWRKERGLGAATMRIRHVPGRLAEVDWAGARAEYVADRCDRRAWAGRRAWCSPCAA